MPVDIRLGIPNTPGRIAKLARALADAGVNIGGIGCDIRPGETWGFVHFLVEDVDAARRAVENTGHEILDVHDVDLVQGDDEPGSLADICDGYLERGENIEVLYLGRNNNIVIGTEGMRRQWTGRRTSETSYSDPPQPVS